MTNDEKAKAYDEALMKIQPLYEQAKKDGNPIWSTYEYLIPQLRESEEEQALRIIKKRMCYDPVPISDEDRRIVENWLEKQKYDRMKPIYDARESFESALEKAWNDYHNGYENVDKLEDDYVECAHAKGFREGYLFGIEKQKEQKPEFPKPHKGDDTNPYDMSASEAQEYTINRGFGIPFNDGEVYVDEKHMTQTIGNILRWADEHPIEPKPWWNLENNLPTTKWTKEMIDEKFKELVEEYHKQKPAEWSEEDELMRTAIIQTLERFGGRGTTGMQIDWLKSIRPAQDCSADCPKHLEGYISGRADAENKLLEMYGILLMPDGELRMKPRWKPSEEQMKALQNAVALTACDKELARLYNQLKKM